MLAARLAHYAPVFFILTGVLVFFGVVRLNAWFSSGGLAKIEQDRKREDEDRARTYIDIHSCRFVAEDSE